MLRKINPSRICWIFRCDHFPSAGHHGGKDLWPAGDQAVSVQPSGGPAADREALHSSRADGTLHVHARPDEQAQLSEEQKKLLCCAEGRRLWLPSFTVKNWQYWLWCLAFQEKIITELLNSCKDQIVSFHEHDSLLDHKVEEELSESERRAAWAEYKAEVIPHRLWSPIRTQRRRKCKRNLVFAFPSHSPWPIRSAWARARTPWTPRRTRSSLYVFLFTNVAAGLCWYKELHLNASLQEMLNRARVTVTDAFLSLNNLRSQSLEEYMSQTVRESVFLFRDHFLFLCPRFYWSRWFWRDLLRYSGNSILTCLRRRWRSKVRSGKPGMRMSRNADGHSVRTFSSTSGK